MRQTCVNVKIHPTKMHLSSCKNATVLRDCKNAKYAPAYRRNFCEANHHSHFISRFAVLANLSVLTHWLYIYHKTCDAIKGIRGQFLCEG